MNNTTTIVILVLVSVIVILVLSALSKGGKEDGKESKEGKKADGKHGNGWWNKLFDIGSWFGGDDGGDNGGGNGGDNNNCVVLQGGTLNSDNSGTSKDWANFAINRLDTYIQDNGPFHGILGYSQGGQCQSHT